MDKPTFIELQQGGDIPPPRRNPSCVAFGDKLYVTGGHLQERSNTFETILDDSYEYDIATGTWKKLDPVMQRTEHKCILWNDQLYYVGGYGRWRYLNTIDAYDPKTDSFSEVSKGDAIQFTPRSAHSVVLWKDNLVIFGGWNGIDFFDETFKFNLVTKQWSVIRSEVDNVAPVGRVNHVAVVYNNHMYIFGGGTKGHYFNDLFEFDLEKEKWRDITSQTYGNRPAPRTRHGAAVVGNKMLIAGGWNSQDYFSDLFSYNFVSKNWIELSKSIPQISHFGLTIYSNSLITFGGFEKEPSNRLYMCKLPPILWTPQQHKFIPLTVRKQIHALLLVRNRYLKERSKVCSIQYLPRDLLFFLFQTIWATQYDMY